MIVFVTVVVTILLLEIISLIIAIIYTNQRITAIEDQLNLFNKNAAAFFIDAEKYIKEFGESVKIGENTYKEEYLTFRDFHNVLDILKKSYK